MPIDIHQLRAQPDEVRNAQEKRFKDPQTFEDVLALDQRWREQTTHIGNLQNQLNRLQKDVIAPLKKRREPCEKEVAEAESIREEIKKLEVDHAKCEQERNERLTKLGNLVDDTVPVSQDELDSNVIGVWPIPDLLNLPCRIGEISYALPETKPLTHDDLLWRVGGYDPDRGSKVAGSRGYFLRDVGVLLNQALINFATGFLRERGYSPIQVPYFMKKDLMAGIAQLSDFDEQLYKVTTGRAGTTEESGDKYLIATSEQPLCALHSKEILDEQHLPLRYCGISTCFRKELGKANMDNRGIFRVHQFEKVEQFCITAGELQESRKMHSEMLQCAEDFHRALGISYRVVNIVSGELNDAAMVKYDLEGWFPGMGQYRELVSCSNCTDFQARAMAVRCKAHHSNQDKVNSNGRLSHVHMLNSTLTATGRGICCILETHQTPEGVRVPEVLVPFMGGMSFLPFVRGPRETQVVATGTASKSTASVNCTSPKKSKHPAAAASQLPAQPASQSASLVAPDSKGAAEMQVLETKLLSYPYVAGFSPSRADVVMLNSVKRDPLDLADFPNIVRWIAHMDSFTPAERASWC